jgi:hypothetical protein
MKLKEYLVKLHQLVIAHPQARELDIVCASDMEGNSFDKVYFDPTIGKFNEDSGEFEDCIDGANAICMN